MTVAVAETILVIDDNEDFLELARDLFIPAGFRVLTASTGEEGLRRAADAPDLVILDVRLPDLGGYEVCRRLRTDPRLKSTPVVMLSGEYIESDDRSEGLETGADSFMTKPVSTRELRATVVALLRMRRAEAELRRSRAAALREAENTRELQRLSQEVMEAARIKEDFLVSISHELGTPLTAVKAYVDTLCADPKLDLHTRKEFFAVLKKEVDRLSRLIVNILDASRLEMGRLDVTFTAFDLNELVAGVVHDIGTRCPIVYEPVAPLPIEGDPDRVIQVLVNLIDNAIKFSPPSVPVLVRAAREGRWAVVRVFDRGPGISPEAAARVFAKFGRAARPGVSSTHGAGLGLYLSSEIVKAQGGHLVLECHPGWGAVFAVSLPLREERA